MISCSREKSNRLSGGAARLPLWPASGVADPQRPTMTPRSARMRSRRSCSFKRIRPSRTRTPPYDSDDRSRSTRSPIKHVILIIGENRTFDHVFATYTPPAGQTV